MKNSTYIVLTMAILSIISIYTPYMKEIPICMTMLACTYWIVRAMEDKNEK
ncbi:MAG: hypothetical protein ACRCXT_16570 [Paraclostridium sp.]